MVFIDLVVSQSKGQYSRPSLSPSPVTGFKTIQADVLAVEYSDLVFCSNLADMVHPVLQKDPLLPGTYSHQHSHAARAIRDTTRRLPLDRRASTTGSLFRHCHRLCQEVTGSSSPISVYCLLGCARNQPPTNDSVHEIRHTTGSRLAVGCDRYGG
jgi:hypothetical protein